MRSTPFFFLGGGFKGFRAAFEFLFVAVRV